MKFFKKMLALTACASMVLTMSACHEKNETALTIDGIKITSALYASALFECDSEARSKVDEANSSSTSSDTSSETDYYSEQIDGVNYVDYVKQQAIQRCKEYAFLQKMIDAGTLKLTDEEAAEAKTAAEYYWSYYSSYYEPNGVAESTYTKTLTYSYYSNAYFMSLYDEGGEKAVDSATISKTLNEKFVLVNVLTKTYDDDATDSTKAALKTTFQGYVDRLNKGESFKTIYEEVNGTTEESTTTTETEQPQDSLAQVLGDEDTDYANDDFDVVKEMAVGDVKLIETTSGLTIYVRKDISADKYYLNNMHDSILYLLKQEEFENNLKEQTDALKVEENSFATNRFKVKKLVYPEAS